MANKMKPTPPGKRTGTPARPTPYTTGPVNPGPGVVTAPGAPSNPGRRVGKNPTPGTPRKVGRYQPPMKKR